MSSGADPPPPLALSAASAELSRLQGCSSQPSLGPAEPSVCLQWVLDKQDLMKERQKDLKFLAEEEYWKLQIFFANVIQALGEHLKLRQQVIATATVYFKRFYARYSLKSIDPVLMAPTCVFLASKVEEFGVVSNTRLISAATSVLLVLQFGWLAAFEALLASLSASSISHALALVKDCCLIVYHPYRPLLQYVQDMGQEDMLLPLAWRIVNDTYRTDLCLLYPPFMIALACLHVACVVQQKDARQWFAELSVDMEKILEIIRVILKLYDQWKNFDDRKEMAAILNKMPKPKPPPNRCHECNEELSTYCNKKVLAQMVDFLQKHSDKTSSVPSMCKEFIIRQKVAIPVLVQCCLTPVLTHQSYPPGPMQLLLAEESNIREESVKPPSRSLSDSEDSSVAVLAAIALQQFKLPVLIPFCFHLSCFPWSFYQLCCRKVVSESSVSEQTSYNTSSKIIKIREEATEGSDLLKGKNPVISTLVPVKGINNLGNTCFFNAVMQDPLVVTLPSPEPLTSAMFLFLHCMKDIGKGPVSPKLLFNQLCHKAPRFKGYQQQDSQELLHYLLDAMRVEETKRIKASILKSFNNPTEKTADEETKRQVKAFGKEGVKMNFVDQIFVGELTNTIMCEECEHISTVKEAFIDLSLPIIEERVSKPANPGRTTKFSKLQERELSEEATSPTLVHPPKNTKKHAAGKDKNHLSYQKTPDKCSFGNEESGNDEEDTPADLKCHYREAGSKKVAANGSEKDGSNLDSSNDADSEASESECPSKQTVNSCTVDYIKTDSSNHSPSKSDSLHSKYKDCNHNESLTCGVSKLSLNNNMNETLISNPNQGEQTDSMSHSKDSAKEKPLISQNPQVAFQSLSHSYVPSSKECSVQSCLYQFTSVELLMGNNKLLCENCTEKRQKHQKRTITTAEKKAENVYTNARKQMLISALPPIVTLHLKRFHQAGMSLRKVNRHVDFPMVLDLAPFCSASCKNVVESERVLYSLYGIVEHSGSMRGGHYTAYVKIRSRHKRQEHRRNVAGQKEAVDTSPGQVDWAALAQAWIAQKESSGPNVVDQQGMQTNGQENQGLDTGPNNHGNFQGDPNFSSMWQPEWGMPHQTPHPPPQQQWMPPAPGPMDVVPPSEDSNSQDSVDFLPDSRHGIFNQNNHNFGGQPENFTVAPMAVNQFDYQHGAAAFGPPSGGFHPPYWQQSPPQSHRDRPPMFRERPRSPIQMPVKQEPPALDAVKRRTLPAWIREGLEKMEREKQKKLEKERMDKQRAEMAKDEEKDKEEPEEEGDGPCLPRKSKFEEEDVRPEAKKVEPESRSPSPIHEEQSEPEMTEEEKEFQLMIMTKTVLTEVLFEVTNEEIYCVAKEVHRKATKGMHSASDQYKQVDAPAKQLAQSSALASLTGLGGLGEYGSDDSEDERSETGSETSDTDDEELRHRIRQKQDAFWRKEKEQQFQERQQVEEEKQSERVNKEMHEYDKEQIFSSVKQEIVKEREPEPITEKRKSRSETDIIEPKKNVKERIGRSRSQSFSGGSSRSSSSESSSSSSSSRWSSSSASSSVSSRSSSRSFTPKRKKKRSRSCSPSHRARQRSRSRSSHRHKREPSREKGRDRRRASRNRSADRSSRRWNPSRSRERRTSRERRKSRSRSKIRVSHSRSRDQHRSADRRRSRSRSKRNQTGSKDRDRRKDRSQSNDKDKKKKDKEQDKKKEKQKTKEKREEKDHKSVGQEGSSTSSRSKRKSESSSRLSRQDSKSTKKGLVKKSKKYSDSSGRSSSCSPEVSKEKKSKKSKRSRSRSTEKSHKSAIVVAESILKIVPSGTYDWDKFINPVDLERILESNVFYVESINGMCYSLLSGSWSWTDSTAINYAIHAKHTT
ncbi:Ubiquitin carboxyl-terminal hydrolase 45 [Acipenser ruthenus]|uniref:Ubiquitin carboxyl-terminal hydrolase 45 n=2 Tax=Euteleostomi TaxID=117571 RepID=A0A444U597_ACIRT|nr:Ubiquitin carboxyl-terminal hydrolase 45 [Acipenser ruthenus]